MEEETKKSKPLKIAVGAIIVIVAIIIIATTLSGNVSDFVETDNQYWEGVSDIKYVAGLTGGGICAKDCSRCANTKTCDIYGPTECTDNAFKITGYLGEKRPMSTICTTCDVSTSTHGIVCEKGVPSKCKFGTYFSQDEFNKYGIGLFKNSNDETQFGTCKLCDPATTSSCEDFKGATKCQDGFNLYKRGDQEYRCETCPALEKSCDENGATECQFSGSFIALDATLGKNTCQRCS